MPESLDLIKGYKDAFEHLYSSGKSNAIENALLLSYTLLPASHIFACCSNGYSFISLQGGVLSFQDVSSRNYYTPFLFLRGIKPIFPAIQFNHDSSPVYFAALPLLDEDGKAFGQVGWINESGSMFETVTLSALQLAASQLSSLITMHAAELNSSRQLKYYFERSPLAIVEWDSSLRVTQWSAKAEELFRWKKQEVEGLTADEFNLVHPESRAYLQELVELTRLNLGESLVIENKNLTKDGEVLICRWHNTVKWAEDGTIQSVFAMVENITSIELANKNLHHSEELLAVKKTELGKIHDLNKAIIAALPDLMFRLTNDGVFADYYISDNDGSSLYLPPETFLGKHVAEVLPQQILEPLYNAFDQLASGKKMALCNYQLTMGSQVKDFESRVTRINNEGYLSIVRDITEAKKAEQQVIYENELLDAVAKIGTQLLGSDNWQAGLERSVAIIGDAFRVSGVYFFEVQTQSDQLVAIPRHQWLKEINPATKSNTARLHINLTDNPELMQQFHLNKIYTSADVNFSTGFKDLFTLQPPQSVIALPLLLNDELFGIMVLAEERYERAWTKEENATLRIVCNNLLTSYTTSQTQKNIKKVNELFGYVMKATNDLIWDWDIEKDVIERSENGFKNITGYDYSEVVQTVDFWKQRLHEEDKENGLKHFDEALNDPKVFFWENQFRFLKKDGFYSHLVDRCYIIRNEAGKAIRAIGATQDVTEQKKAVLELANSEQRFRSMIYNISDVITLIDKDGIVIYQSASSKRILGFDDGEIVGKSVFSMIHPDDVERTAQSFNELLLKEGASSLIQFRYLTKKGSYLSLEAIGNNQLGNPAINAIIVVSRDVTDRVTLEEAIKASEEKFRSLVHNISDIISIISPAGKILYQSSSVKQKMGYEENELTDRTIADIVHPEDLDGLMNAFGTLIKTGGTSDPMEIRILNKDGNYFYNEAQATNQIDNPTIQGIVMTSRDISQRKKTEEERKILIEELTKNNADLTQFSYIVSHDLRAPVTNLIAMIKLLDFGTIQNQRSLKLLEGFKISTFKLRDTLNDLTDVMVVKNNPNVELKMLDFEKVFTSVSQSISSIIEKSGAVIKLDFTEAPVVKFSEPYLESIFQNMLTNSIRYANPEKELKVNVAAKKQGSNILLTFTDNGIGFNMDLVKGKIFGLHQRFHHHPESRGIGLYLIHSQITSLGGTITVQSEEGMGTTFFITLKN